jgi:hypothetical protein
LPPWSKERNRRIWVPIEREEAMIGTFMRNGDLALAVDPRMPRAAIGPVLAALKDLGYRDVQLLGLDCSIA